MEVWSPIVGFPHYYISSQGRVFSDKKKRFLQIRHISHHGHTCIRVKLSRNDITHLHSVAILMLKAFQVPKTNDQTHADHINQISTDNRIENLRWTTPSENMLNRKRWGKSKYRGVHRHGKNNAWVACCTHQGKCHYLGSFRTEEDAGRAYDEYCKKNGINAFLNFG